MEEDTNKIKQRFELLKMAKELLNEDYINRRAEDHNKWVAENDELWRTHRRNLPYPPFAQYPTDDEIVKAASNLYNFIYLSDIEAPIHTQVVSPPIETINQTELIHPDSIEIKNQESANIDTPDELQVIQGTEYKTPTKEEIKTLEAKATRGLLPGWIRRST